MSGPAATGNPGPCLPYTGHRKEFSKLHILHREGRFAIQVLRHVAAKAASDPQRGGMDLVVVFTQADRALISEMVRPEYGFERELIVDIDFHIYPSLQGESRTRGGYAIWPTLDTTPSVHRHARREQYR